MRASVLILFLFLRPSVAISQSASQENTERIVKAALNPKSDVIYEGFSEGPLNRSGDACAVAITKVVGDKDLSPDEINRILMIIHKSFAAPTIVESEPDRQARTTLFVLKYLDSLPVTPELKRRIAETKKFVEQSAKSITSGKPKT